MNTLDTEHKDPDGQDWNRARRDFGTTYDGFPDFQVDKEQLSNDHEELRTKTVFKVPGLLKIGRIPLND